MLILGIGPRDMLILGRRVWTWARYVHRSSRGEDMLIPGMGALGDMLILGRRAWT